MLLTIDQLKLKPYSLIHNTGTLPIVRNMTYHGAQQHPMCKDEIIEVTNCYKERYIAKFYGACEDLRKVMDKCLQKEVHRFPNVH